VNWDEATAMGDQYCGRKLVASAGKLAVRVAQQADSQYRTDAFDALKASFEYIEKNDALTATEALKHHFNAMAFVIKLGSYSLLKETPLLFRSCENMIRTLIEEGANVYELG